MMLPTRERPLQAGRFRVPLSHFPDLGTRMNLIRTSASRLLIGAIAFTVLALPVSAQGPQELMNQGMEAYDAGDYETAIAKFRQILAAEPSNSEAMELLANSEDALLELLVAGGEWEMFAREVMAAAAEAGREARRDIDAAAADAAGVFSDDFSERQQAIFKLANTYGPFAAPPLAKELASDKESRRLAAIYALSRMGSQLFLPVVTCCFSTNAQVRLGALHVLNEMNDPRADAIIAGMAENDPDGAVRALAGQIRVPGDPAALHVEQAKAYMNGDLNRGLPPAENYGVLWTTDGANLIPYEVPTSVVALELAKFHLLGAEQMGSDAAEPLLARVYASQVAALRADPETMELAPAQMNALASLPHSILNGALKSALDADDVLGAEVMIEALDAWAGKAWSSLTLGLESGTPSVRFASALALAHTLDVSPAVVAALGECLAAEAIRVVHLCDTDAARADALAAALEAAGVTVVRATTGSDAIVNSNLAATVDAFVVSDPMSGLYAKRFVDGLRNGRFADTPVFVYGNEQTELDNAEVVEELDAATVIGAFGELDGARAERAMVALRASRVMVYIALQGKAGPAVESMAQALSRDDDEIVTWVCAALGYAQDASVVPALLDLLADESRNDEPRAAAASALAALARSAGATVDMAVVQAAMEGAGPLLGEACAKLVGASESGHVPAVVEVQ